MGLEVSIKNQYGNELVYPECERAKALCKLSGHKTLTEDSIRVIKELGYTFKVVSKKIAI